MSIPWMTLFPWDDDLSPFQHKDRLCMCGFFHYKDKPSTIHNGPIAAHILETVLWWQRNMISMLDTEEPLLCQRAVRWLLRRTLNCFEKLSIVFFLFKNASISADKHLHPHINVRVTKLYLYSGCGMSRNQTYVTFETHRKDFVLIKLTTGKLSS